MAASAEKEVFRAAAPEADPHADGDQRHDVDADDREVCLGLLRLFLDPHDLVAVDLGDFRLSALFVIKAIAITALLLWAANLVSSFIDNRIAATTELSPSFKVLGSRNEYGQVSILIQGKAGSGPVFAEAAKAGVQVRYFGPDTLTLEDVFVTTFRGGEPGGD